MIDYTYLTVSQLCKKVDNFNDRLVTLSNKVSKISKNKHFSNYKKINALKKLGLLKFQGDISDYKVTNLDKHVIFSIVKFGLHATYLYVTAHVYCEVDNDEKPGIEMNKNMYDSIVAMKYTELHNYQKYEKLLPKYYNQLTNFYKNGYDFTYE